MIAIPQIIIFFRLLAAHVLADFFLQRYKWIVDKRTGIHSSYLYYHMAIVGAMTYLLLADWTNWQVPLFVMITHFLIDWWKSTQKDCTRNFILDQVFHITILVIAWLWYIGYSFGDAYHWLSGLNSIGFWVVLCSYLLVLRPAGFLIGKATNSWQTEMEATPSTASGLTKAGTWIGYLERVIILTLFLISQYSAVGFLIAAKSIFRFSGQENKERTLKQAEYILIGTLMSFLLAILIGIGARYFLQFA